MKKLLVIDGNSLLFRAYYATSYSGAIMTTKDGVPTNAIFAFANMLTKLLSSFHGDESIFIGFDADSHTFRKDEYAEYKANRKPCPEELKKQFPISRELCHALGILCYEEHGVEADDLCGTVAKLASQQGYEVMIYTSDRDYLQLIDSQISVSLLKTGLSNMDLITEGNMVEKFGFTPKQIIDYKGLRGDDSDNLPGIPGIGDKTAIKLIHEYGSLDAIFAAAPNQKGKVWENIRNNEAQGRACYHLATILTDVKLPFTLEDLVYHGYSFEDVSRFANRYELHQLLSRLPARLKQGGSNDNGPSLEMVKAMPLLTFTGPCGLALDLDFSEYHDEIPSGVAVANGEKAYYEAWEDFLQDKPFQAWLADASKEKEVYDGKATIYALGKAGFPIAGIQNDILLMAYLLDSSITDDPTLVYTSFGVDVSDTNESQGGLLAQGKPKTTMKMAYYALHLLGKAETSLKAVDAYRLYHEVEFPLMFVLAKMEQEGFPLHPEVLKGFGEEFQKQRDAAQAKVYELAKHPFNLNSPKQIATVLYTEMGIPDTKHGSTSSDVLEEERLRYPIIDALLTYRKYAKLMSTYVEGLLPCIKSDGKIHSYFNQAQTSTGRLSSSSPNLQNISVRDEEGRQIRKAFYYDDPSVVLLSLDYHQIELRLLAALSHCQNYIDVFNEGRDVHTETAKRIFHVDEVTPELRRKAKAVNFAIIYGTSVFGLAQQIGGSRAEAQEIIRSFYLTYPEVGTYLNSLLQEVNQKGYVTTMFGRRRYFRDLKSSNYQQKAAAERAALNAPVQGSAADLIKLAMVKVDEFLTKEHLQTKMVLQIHDELIFRVPQNELEYVKTKISDIMTHAVDLPVSLTVEAGIGHTWYDAKD